MPWKKQNKLHKYFWQVNMSTKKKKRQNKNKRKRKSLSSKKLTKQRKYLLQSWPVNSKKQKQRMNLNQKERKKARR